ncbi:Separase [Camellia lanceoleosa]|uniref:Separase n=1 Tax=Camellia lanceoleosa TaxID=1840588 RepID=A0ACC0GBS1_9ERIC|nr:Separase [Camellia lanceoleosa]
MEIDVKIYGFVRVLDASAHEKLHRMLVTNLSKCTLFLVGELTCFNKDLLCEVCSATFAEYPKSNMKDQLPKCNRKGFSIDIFSICCRLGCYGSSQSAIFGEATINLLIMLMH